MAITSKSRTKSLKTLETLSPKTKNDLRNFHYFEVHLADLIPNTGFLSHSSGNLPTMDEPNGPIE